MGEIAEMILDGLLDEETGELIDGTAPGYPRRMSDMRSHMEFGGWENRRKVVPMVKCPICKRKLRGPDGLADHRKAKGH